MACKYNIYHILWILRLTDIFIRIPPGFPTKHFFAAVIFGVSRLPDAAATIYSRYFSCVFQVFRAAAGEEKPGAAWVKPEIRAAA
jgi:hypothetical protein